MKCLTEDHLDQEIQPTNGFYIKTLPIRNVVISIKEIGGLDRLRKYWPNYFDEKQAILYVVNASDNEENLNESCDTLRQVLKDERLKSKPCLILGRRLQRLSKRVKETSIKEIRSFLKTVHLLSGTHADRPNSRSDQELKSLFQSIVGNDRKWSISICSSFNKNQVLDTIEILIDMMLNTS